MNLTNIQLASLCMICMTSGILHFSIRGHSLSREQSGVESFFVGMVVGAVLLCIKAFC